MAFDQHTQKVNFLPFLTVSNKEIVTFSRPVFEETSARTLSAFARDTNSPSWIIEEGSIAGCVSFLDQDKYVGSSQKGDLFHAEKKQTWENFFFIALQDLDLLRSLLFSRFRVAGASDEDARKLGLQCFNLTWNGRLFRLNQNCPLSGRFDGKALVLSADNEQLVLENETPASQKPVIWINSKGNIGNRALQYLTAEGIRERVPDAQIQNIHLEMWGIKSPAQRPPIESCASTGVSRYSIDAKGLGDCLRRGEVDAVAIDSYTFCLDHYPSREKCREFLPAAIGTEHVTGFGEIQLVCNIRGGDILSGVHGDYVPLPVRYYQLLEEESGLEMVFYGQIGDDTYSENLRRHFPHARFVRSQGAEIDFETIRRSKNIAISISTFSWLAAWLSHARRIYVPVGGMFNPVQHPEQTYLPVEDDAFHFVLLPYAKTVSLYERPQEFWRVQERISKFVRFATRAEIQELLNRMTTWPMTQRIMTGPFDAKFYCRQYPHAASDVLALKTTALEHYLEAGYQNSRITAFDEAFYGETYPDAEADVTLGRFPNLLNHFICKGWQLGYKAIQ